MFIVKSVIHSPPKEINFLDETGRSFLLFLLRSARSPNCLCDGWKPGLALPPDLRQKLTDDAIAWPHIRCVRHVDVFHHHVPRPSFRQTQFKWVNNDVRINWLDVHVDLRYIISTSNFE